MRISLTASLFLALGFINPVNMSFSSLPEDSEGSGYDLDTSGSGSGDWSEQGEKKHIKDHPDSKDVKISAVNTGGEPKNTLHGSSVLNFDSAHGESGSGFIIVANSKSFLENKQVFAGVIAGGVTGVAVAAALAGLLIYTWQRKANGGYSMGQQRASDEHYHRPTREEVVL